MAKQTINIGTSANDGTGSTLREAFDITNDNFTELYDGTGGLLHKIEGTNFTGSLLVGHSTTGILSSAENNTGVGIGALDALTTGDSNVAVGFNTLTALTTGSSNVAIGNKAMLSGPVSGDDNIMIGELAGNNIIGGSQNVGIGTKALFTENNDGRNVAVGHNSLMTLRAGADAYNVAVGYDAGKNITTGLSNTLIGGLTGDALLDGNNNVAIGKSALSAETDGSKNTAIGTNALQVANGANSNVALGRHAGVSVSTGDQNTMLGANAGDAITTGSNNTIIGYDAAASAVDVSNEVTIGNSSITNVRIPSDSTLKIGASGDLQIEHVSSNSFIKNTAVGDLYIENQVDDGDVIFRSDNGSGGLATYFYLDGEELRTIYTKDLRTLDNTKILIGNGADLQIYHDGSSSQIDNYTGNLLIKQRADDADIIFSCDDGSGGTTTYMFLDGANKRVKTTEVLTIQNSSSLRIGDAESGQLYVESGNTVLKQVNSGNISIRNEADDSDIIFSCDDGSGGVAEYFRLDGSAASGGYLYTNFPDNSILSFGNASDLLIYHDTTNSQIFNKVGDLVIRNDQNDGDIEFLCDNGSGGVTEYFRLDGGDENVLFSKILKLSDNVELRIGSSNDIKIYYDTSNSYIKTGTVAGNLIIEQNTDDADIIFKCDNGAGSATPYITLDGSNVRTQIDREMRFMDTIPAKFGTSGDLQIYHDSTDSIMKNTVGNLYISNSADDKDIIFQCDDGSGGLATYFKLDGSFADSTFRYTVWEDNSIVALGANADLSIYHDATDSIISNSTGNLTIQNTSDDSDIIFKSDDGSGGTTSYFELDGSESLNKFRKNLYLLDNVGLKIGNSFDLDIKHDGSDSYIQNSTGDLYIKNFADDKDIIFKSDDGSGGTTTYMFLDGSLKKTQFWQSTRHIDNVYATFGTSDDLQIYHDGSNSFVAETGTGGLFLEANSEMRFRKQGTSEIMAQFLADSECRLYHNNIQKFATKSTGINISGVSEYADNTAAIAAGLTTGDVYRTGDLLKIVH